MDQPEGSQSDVDRFLRDRIDSVPHLEALLLLWNSRPKAWEAPEMAARLFVPVDTAQKILDDLVRLKLIATNPGVTGTYWYQNETARDLLVEAVDATYRRELIRVSALLHSKPSAAVRAFARAFRLREHDE